LLSFDQLTAEDVVIIPAFGTTLEIEAQLNTIGIQTAKYNTTCPFVEKVWNRGEMIAKQDYTIIIHGKPKHEETRATFSHASLNAPSVVIEDMQQAVQLSKYITGERSSSLFYEEFKGQYSPGFDVSRHLQRIGVVNQTTMLASDTQAIADFLKGIMFSHFGLDIPTTSDRFADTRDTLCYATNDNQTAVTGMLSVAADIAVVTGGYNSSNTSHLVELCEEKLPTYFISSEDKILSQKDILHYDFHGKQEILTSNFLPSKDPVNILITSGASCPDAVVESVIKKLVSFFPVNKTLEELAERFR
jgi:4-hydroxy-3-methylbut-2-enyl diphosphate reductase